MLEDEGDYMNKNILKNFGIGVGSAILGAYALFLIAPFIVSPIANSYIPMINGEVKKATGLTSKIENFRIVTTPKLTVGATVGEFKLLTPDNQEIVEAENFQVKMSLLPLLRKRIEIDLVQVEDVDVKLALNNDGSFVLEKYLPTSTATPSDETTSAEPLVLPLGLRLSNQLPNIKIREYKINFVDSTNNDSYLIKGGKTEITDFVLNKHVKVLASGNMTLKGREQFVYNLKINNKIMPDLDLHELVFNPQPAENEGVKTEPVKINVLNILKEIYSNKITAKVDTDLTLGTDSRNGYVNLTNLGISPNGIYLPPGNTNLKFSGDKIDINSNLYTAQNEVSSISGIVRAGKKTNIDLNFKSAAELNNIIKIINAIAMTFDFDDLKTLSAKGKLDADFNVKSNLKNINSNGYLRIPDAQIRYGLYNVTIDDINADVVLDNNNINIKNVGFAILNQPLRFFGTIDKNAVTDLHLTANELSLKGLLVALGQAVLLKDNNVAGTVSLNADIVGKLDKIKPTCKIRVNGVNIKNLPSNTTLSLPKTTVDILADGAKISGNAVSENAKIINPAATVTVPKLVANINESEIEITQTSVQIEKIMLNVAGKIKDYMTPKIGLDFVTTGDIKSTLKGGVNLNKGSLDLVFAAPQNSTIIVPMFDKSRLTFNGNIAITGNMMNPVLSGTVNVPTLSIPEIPVTMDNLVAKIHGTILNGKATVAKFTSGGIVAENLSTDFSLKGENFYLKNLTGTAFDGKIRGKIIYNLVNAKTSIDFKGEEMDVEKAIAGAVGLNGAMSGTLSFDTKMTLRVLDYNEMMKSLKGNLTFRVDNGAFGKIGRLENMLGASNIVGNAILKTTVSALSTIAGVKNSAVFDYITGEMTFDNGWANISSIKSTGKTLAYFVYGKYNLINGTTNVTILGRLHASVVSMLGPIGELSAEKLLGAIPKFGPLTAKFVGIMTTNPQGERVSEIPALSGGEALSSEFKVVFNGGIESASSVKSFKWLSTPDMSALEPVSVVDTVKSLKDTVNVDLSNTVKTTVDTFNTQKELLKNTAGELKNLFKF